MIVPCHVPHSGTSNEGCSSHGLACPLHTCPVKCSLEFKTHLLCVNVCYVVQTGYDFVLINMWKDSYCFTVWKPITTCFKDRYAFILLVLLFEVFFPLVNQAARKEGSLG